MLKVSSLTKKYGAVTALSGVSFEIEKGMVYGLLGPNGAGKSTAMNIIAGVISGQGDDAATYGLGDNDILSLATDIQ